MEIPARGRGRGVRSSTCPRAAELELYLRGCPRHWCARWRHGARHTTERATRPTSTRRRQRTPSASFSLPPANPLLLSKSLSRRPRERRRPPGRRDNEKYAAGAAAAPLRRALGDGVSSPRPPDEDGGFACCPLFAAGGGARSLSTWWHGGMVVSWCAARL